MSDKIKHSWEKSKHQKSCSHTQKNEKMKSIEAFTSRNIKSYECDNYTRYDKKDLEQTHKREEEVIVVMIQ